MRILPTCGPFPCVTTTSPPGGRGGAADPVGGGARGGVHLLVRVRGAAAQQRVPPEGDHDPVHRAPSRAARRWTKVTISAVRPVPWSRGYARWPAQRPCSIEPNGSAKWLTPTR